MLLEQLVEKAGRKPEHDWDAYYDWVVRAHAGRDIDGYAFWQCRKCLTTNLLLLPARYGKCRCCDLIHLP